MQHLLSSGPLLNEDGNLAEAGYAFQLVRKYDRKAIKAGSLRIKEWDYYYLGDKEYGLALTIDDNSYMSLASVSLLDFKNNKQITQSVMGLLPKGKLAFPSDSKTGDVFYKNSRVEMKFLHEGEVRHLLCTFRKFRKDDDFTCDLIVKEHNKDTMVIATPFNKKGHFYYNQKTNNLEAEGTFALGQEKHEVKGYYGVLDWGRGVWTYKNTWYWASMSGIYEGHLVGFNLGYGFGDTSSASENMLFYDGKGYKMDDVSFNIPTKNGKDDYLASWTFTSQSGDISLTFTPLLDRYSKTDLGIIGSLQNQVFGLFSGCFRKDGQTFEFKDMLGLAEKVTNKW